MKIEPRLPQLPSLGELLEHPRVKGLVERINRSTIAQRAGGFLEEIRASLAERAGRVEIPSLTHLAERLARRLLGEPVAAGPVINATGVLLGDPALAMPLAEPALHAIVKLGGEYHRRHAALVRSAERAVGELADDHAAHLVSSIEVAVMLAVTVTAGNRELVLCGDLDATQPINWRWIAARASTILLPAPSSWRGGVGRGDDAGTHAATPPLQGEGSGSIPRGAAAILRTPEAEDVELSSLAASKPSDACLIDVAPFAGLMNPREHGYEAVPTVVERLSAGADLVIVDGSGLFGGPACGLVIGRRPLVDAVARHPLASLLAAEPLTVAALDSVLKVYDDQGDDNLAAIYQLPVWQLLTAPLANLEQRAKRLAALMAESPGIASAEARQVESPWRQWGQRTWAAKTWCIELRPSDDDAAALRSKLAQGPQPILSRAADGGVHLDLRTVFPRWDQQLVAAVEGPQSPAVAVRAMPESG